jgi:hypothetical protein
MRLVNRFALILLRRIGDSRLRIASKYLALDMASSLYGAETWTLRAVDQKHLKSFEMWC